MTENLKSALRGINEFIWMAINYDSVLYKFRFTDRETYIPRFVAETPWTCDTDHLANKWLGIAEDMPDGYGRLVKFYLQLDNSNKIALLEWIMNNPVDGRKLSFPSED